MMHARGDGGQSKAPNASASGTCRAGIDPLFDVALASYQHGTSSEDRHLAAATHG
jgi:hypothetical protein